MAAQPHLSQNTPTLDQAFLLSSADAFILQLASEILLSPPHLRFKEDKEMQGNESLVEFYSVRPCPVLSVCVCVCVAPPEGMRGCWQAWPGLLGAAIVSQSFHALGPVSPVMLPAHLAQVQGRRTFLAPAQSVAQFWVCSK